MLRVLSICLLLLLPSVASAELIFTAESKVLGLGTTDFEVDIRVSSSTGTDTLQFFSILASVQTISNPSGATLSLDLSNSISDTLVDANYVLTGKGSSFSGASSPPALISTVAGGFRITDGVAIPAGASGGGSYDGSPVNPGTGAGKLVARLHFIASAPIDLGDHFKLNLAGFGGDVNEFDSNSGIGSGSRSFSFAGAATSVSYTPATNTYTGSNLNPSNFIQGNLTAVPEPSSVCLVGLAVGGLALRRRKRA